MTDNKFILLIAIIVIVVFAKKYTNRFFDPRIARTDVFTVMGPEGWTREVEGGEVVFMTPERDLATGYPEAMFTVNSQQSKSALFLEDLFHEVWMSLKKQGFKIYDRGELKIDDERAKWVLYRNRNPDLVVMDFFIVDSFNRLTKIEYISLPKTFKEYRPQFEEFKSSFKFKKLF